MRRRAGLEALLADGRLVAIAGSVEADDALYGQCFDQAERLGS
jgi:hypothetical protein